MNLKRPLKCAQIAVFFSVYGKKSGFFMGWGKKWP